MNEAAKKTDSRMVVQLTVDELESMLQRAWMGLSGPTEPAPESTKPATVHTYFIHAQKLEAVKIGKSGNPTERFNSLRTSTPDKLVMVGTVEGDREDEFHTRFAEYRTSGEWFSMGPELMDFLRAEFNFIS